MSYSKTTWNDDDVITKEKMNNLESGVESANDGLPGTATTQTAGTVKQAAAVPEAAGEQVTQSEFKALLDSLKAAGIMANA